MTAELLARHAMIDDATWNFIGILTLTVMAYMHGRIPGRAPFLLYCLWSFPGTFLHEVAHLTVGTLLLARPRAVDLVPRMHKQLDREGRAHYSYHLGEVSFASVRFWNALPIGLAPLLLLPAAWLLYGNLESVSGPFIVVKYIGVYVITYGAIPSTTDLRVGLAPASLAFWSLVGSVTYLLNA